NPWARSALERRGAGPPAAGGGPEIPEAAAAPAAWTPRTRLSALSVSLSRRSSRISSRVSGSLCEPPRGFPRLGVGGGMTHLHPWKCLFADRHRMTTQFSKRGQHHFHRGSPH